MAQQARGNKSTPQPPQHQKRQPGIEKAMRPRPQSEASDYQGCAKLTGKVALITGGDSGIGKAVALAFAKEGADVQISYLDEHTDAQRTVALLQDAGVRAGSIAGDIAHEKFCQRLVAATIKKYGRLDILVNNAGEQHPQKSLEDISAGQLEQSFRTNVFGMFFVTKAALPHLARGSAIINTASVTAYRGSPELLDYSATKGAIVSFTRSLAENLVKKGIRVNAVAPGPIWTPLIPASYSAKETAEHGADSPMQRPGQPDEVAPCYVFLASNDSSYMTGQVLHPNGGTVVNG